MKGETSKKERKADKAQGDSSIQISQEEVWAFNVLDGQVMNAMTEAKRLQAARDAFIKLLEKKYKAVFNQETGKLEKKVK